MVIVEGKYDAQRINEIYDCTVITTDGFGVFRNREKRELISLLGNRFGAVIVTDSDKAGVTIRNAVKQLVDKDKVIHVYVPDIFGKEKRKEKPSREGKLGVEGISHDTIKAAFENQGVFAASSANGGITKARLYELGLSGGENSDTKRKALQKKLDLPQNMSANAFLQIINRLMSSEDFESFVLREFA